jgi:photosystem II stability/assembly factor-like uncharacterized protein
MVTTKLKTLAVGLGLFLVAEIGVSCTLPTSTPKFPNTQSTKRKKDTDILEKLGDRPIHNIEGCFVDMEFTNEREGWLSCLGQLWKTSDGGRNWERIYENDGRRTAMFYFVNSQVGWSNTLHTLHKSEDGGRTWKAMALPFKSSDEGEIISIKFLNDGLRGWIAGGVYRSYPQKVLDMLGTRSLSSDGKKAITGVIFYTEDGGKTWSQQPIASEIGNTVGGLQITEKGRVWAFSGVGLFYLADNKWQKVGYNKGQCSHQVLLETVDYNKRTFESYGPTALSFIDDKQGWLSFANGYVAKTTDGGHTWCDLFDFRNMPADSNNKLFLSEMYFTDAMNGWALAAGFLYQTKDGGMTWTKIDTDIEFDDMFFLDAGHGWAVGKEGLFRLRTSST